VLYKATTDDRQRQRVERRLEAALQAQPDSLSLLASLATFRSLQGHNREAEAIYRKILARDRRNVVALNNLAWRPAVEQRKGTEALHLVQQAIEIVGPLPHP